MCMYGKKEANCDDLSKDCYLDQTPNSSNQFTRKCVTVKGENWQSDHKS